MKINTKKVYIIGGGLQRRLFAAALFFMVAIGVHGESVEMLRYGDFENWVTRNIKESAIIGGQTKQVFEIAPNATIDGDKPYTNQGGSPWATSNIMAKVVGITKCSNAVFPDVRAKGNRCCKLTTLMENCKAIGLINVDVAVTGSIFLGKFLEPVKSTKEPYSKMEMGIPFTKRPKALRFDYKVYMPEKSDRIYSGAKRPMRAMTTRRSISFFSVVGKMRTGICMPSAWVPVANISEPPPKGGSTDTNCRCGTAT